jgi:hypothetical protein
MVHKKSVLSAYKDFGYVYNCTCDQYLVHLKGLLYIWMSENFVVLWKCLKRHATVMTLRALEFIGVYCIITFYRKDLGNYKPIDGGEDGESVGIEMRRA